MYAIITFVNKSKWDLSRSFLSLQKSGLQLCSQRHYLKILLYVVTSELIDNGDFNREYVRREFEIMQANTSYNLHGIPLGFYRSIWTADSVRFMKIFLTLLTFKWSYEFCSEWHKKLMNLCYKLTINQSNSHENVFNFSPAHMTPFL